jgi:hypothetical protein
MTTHSVGNSSIGPLLIESTVSASIITGALIKNQDKTIQNFLYNLWNKMDV